MNELLYGFGSTMLYFAVCASSAFLLRVKTRVPDEVFRKLLHGILLGSLLVWVNVYTRWWVAAAACMLLVLLVYPILWLLEQVKGFSEFITERRTGELKSSLVQVFGMFALVMAICWGIFADRLLVLASVYAWGFGDAAAALVGKRFGRHKFRWRAAGGKSYEGTAAMFVTSFASTLVILLVRGGLGWLGYLVIAFVTALVSAFTELITPNGHDTVTCPLEAMVTLLILLYALGGL